MRPSRAYCKFLACALALGGAGAAAAQLLPGPAGGVVRDVGRVGGDVLDGTRRSVERVGASARGLARDRLNRLRKVVRASPERLEMTDEGPAVRGEIVAVDPDAATLAAAAAAGFAVAGEERIAGLDIRAVTLRPPPGLSLDKALAVLRRVAPDAALTANHLHFQSGTTTVSARRPRRRCSRPAAARGGRGSGSSTAAWPRIRRFPARPSRRALRKARRRRARTAPPSPRSRPETAR